MELTGTRNQFAALKIWAEYCELEGNECLINIYLQDVTLCQLIDYILNHLLFI